jgi:hypothetical protein
VKSENELSEFVGRAYGKNCVPIGESGYDNRKNVFSYTIGGGESCPSSFPVQDVVVWDREKNLAPGYQSGRVGHLTKAYYVNLDLVSYYVVDVGGVLSSRR